MEISNLDRDNIIQAVKNWVGTVVIGLNLCPFAGREWDRNTIRFTVSAAKEVEQLLMDLQIEFRLLLEDESIETTLLIHPVVLQDFYDYNQFLDHVDDLLDLLHLSGVFQVASFHPQYQFAKKMPDDVENYTNRSPYPMLHIIREASLEKAIADYPDTSLIPIHNKRLMREMGTDQMQALWQACFVD